MLDLDPNMQIDADYKYFDPCIDIEDWLFKAKKESNQPFPKDILYAIQTTLIGDRQLPEQTYQKKDLQKAWYKYQPMSCKDDKCNSNMFKRFKLLCFGKGN